MKNRIIIPVAILCVLISVLLCIKHVNEKEEEEIVREATQEEILVEEYKQEEIEEEIPEVEEPVIEEEVIEVEDEEPVVELSPQEQARAEIVEEHGEKIVDAWEKLSRMSSFDYIGYKLIIEETYDLEHSETMYHCYKVMEDGSLKSAHVGGNYYICGVFLSPEALFDLVDYHNEFFAVVE